MAIKYQIVSGIEKTDKVVNVCLEQNEKGDISLLVDNWYVFKLNTNGTGTLHMSIYSGNESGLKVDKRGRIKLENK